MAMHKEQLPQRVRVRVWEYERGWGSRLDDTLYFDTKEEAEAYCKDFNKDNTAAVAPDWYMVARIE